MSSVGTGSFHWLDAWNAISISLTGFFGVLGLLTEFKDKTTRRVTKWGWVSLCGIVVSTICGTWAQVTKSNIDAQVAREQTKISNDTLEGIRIALSPLQGSTLYVTFAAPCTEGDFPHICAELKGRAKRQDWRFDRPPSGVATLVYTVSIYSRREDAAKIWSSTAVQPDIEFQEMAKGNENPVDIWAVYVREEDDVLISRSDTARVYGPSSSTFQSIRQLPGAYAVVEGWVESGGLIPTMLTIQNNIGETVECHHFEKISAPASQQLAFGCPLEKWAPNQKAAKPPVNQSSAAATSD